MVEAAVVVMSIGRVQPPIEGVLLVGLIEGVLRFCAVEHRSLNIFLSRAFLPEQATDEKGRCFG